MVYVPLISMAGCAAINQTAYMDALKKYLKTACTNLPED